MAVLSRKEMRHPERWPTRVHSTGWVAPATRVDTVRHRAATGRRDDYGPFVARDGSQTAEANGLGSCGLRPSSPVGLDHPKRVAHPRAQHRVGCASNKSRHRSAPCVAHTPTPRRSFATSNDLRTTQANGLDSCGLRPSSPVGLDHPLSSNLTKFRETPRPVGVGAISA